MHSETLDGQGCNRLWWRRSEATSKTRPVATCGREKHSWRNTSLTCSFADGLTQFWLKALGALAVSPDSSHQYLRNQLLLLVSGREDFAVLASQALGFPAEGLQLADWSWRWLAGQDFPPESADVGESFRRLCRFLSYPDAAAGPGISDDLR